MQDDEQLERVRALRAKGAAPKEIARALGIPPARVKTLVRTVASTEQYDPAEAAVVECWVSRGWSQGLGVPQERGWPDEPEADDGSSGLAGVLVARNAGRNRVSACGHLVDTYCLGVKDSIGPRVMDQHGLPAFVSSFFDAFSAPPVPASLEHAQHLALGAVDYARGLGFEPARDSDFDQTRSHLGDWAGPSCITFGRDGKPMYVSGPRDNAESVLKTLRETVGAGNFDYLLGAPM